MILADTSAWVEHDRATDSPAVRRVTELIAVDGPLVVTNFVVVEVLAVARSDAREEDLRHVLRRFGFVPFDAVTDFDAAARTHRRCRQQGVTPRGMVDCMIAAVAHRCGATLLFGTSTSTVWRESSGSSSMRHRCVLDALVGRTAHPGWASVDGSLTHRHADKTREAVTPRRVR